jgi:hypothetical protein
VIALVLALVLQPPTHDDNPHFRAAVEAWDAGRWDEAARAFGAAYADDPRPEYLFAQARARRLGGDCKGALPLFERFVDLGPPPSAIDDAQTNIRECEAQLAAAEPASVASVPPPVVSTPERDAPPVEAPRKSVAKDALGHALVWPGVAVLGAGAAMLGVAHTQGDHADEAADEQAYRDRLGAAPELSQAGIALAAVGGALVVAGIVRFAVLGARARKRPTHARWSAPLVLRW